MAKVLLYASQLGSTGYLLVQHFRYLQKLFNYYLPVLLLKEQYMQQFIQLHLPFGSPWVHYTKCIFQQLNSDSSLNGVLPIAADKSQKASSTNVSTDSSGSRAGLFRTPISGGVQSATFAHGLPPPALAVRNLMEQVAPAIYRLKASCL